MLSYLGQDTGLEPLLGGLPHCLVLENAAGELQILLPNHDVHRPSTAGVPFTTDLVFDRGSMGWQHVMETRYYLYPVHRSKSFLVPRSLGATLYLLLLRLFARNYSEVFVSIDTCCVDTPFSAEELWVFQQFVRTCDDRHPVRFYFYLI